VNREAANLPDKLLKQKSHDKSHPSFAFNKITIFPSGPFTREGG